MIKPALAAGADVVCDRFIDSTVAYQGVGRGLGVELVERAERGGGRRLHARSDDPPQVDPDEAARRGQQRLAEGLADGNDRFEAEGPEFQRTIAEAYDRIAAENPDRFEVVDATRHRRRGPRGRDGGGPGRGPMTTAAALPEHIERATERQPAARAALAAALAAGPSHAYLFAGPGGAEMRDAARAFAAELIATGAPDPESARRRALIEPSPHPDLVWLTPPGAQHLVEEVREQVIKGIAYRPFEGERRVFVIEDAEAMADESQNALLRTLEEPPGFAHLLLLSAEPDGLKPTVTSRCQRVRFAALTPEAIEAAAEGRRRGPRPASLAPPPGSPGATPSAPASSSASTAPSCARASSAGRRRSAPARSAGRRGARSSSSPRPRAPRPAPRSSARWSRAARRRGARRRSAPHATRRRPGGAPEGGGAPRSSTSRSACSARGFATSPRSRRARRRSFSTPTASSELEAAAKGLDPRRARRAAELSLEARRRLRVNVSEELALESLSFRAEFLLRNAR